jgi:cellulose synthase/poly-beta-1,6-N-acetylglucosamine synthase-like glycosyltransferase
MKLTKLLLYGSVSVAYFVLLHMYLPPIFSSGVKRAIDRFILDPLTYWWFIFSLFGLFILLGFVIYYGIHFLASFGRGYKVKNEYHAKVSILIASKNERILLERTLNSILKSTYPKENIQIIIITSGSTDETTEFSKNFAKENSMMDIEVLSENLPKMGKPPALNYGLKYVKNDIVVLYDSGCILEPNTLSNLIAPFQDDKIKAVIGPVLVENWKTNKLTRGIYLDYAMISGGGITFEIKNRLGSSAYAFGRNFAVTTKQLQKYGGFNEDSMTEDLYLSVLLNLDGINIFFSPRARVFEYVPTKWEILVKQRTRWLAGYVFDMPQLMSMKSEEKSGKSIIISRNMTMMLIGNLDTWIPIVIGFAIFQFLTGEWYLLTWTLSCLISQFGFLFNAVRKYGDGHYNILLFFLVSAFIHLYMFLRQFRLPKEISWEKTPMILEKQEEEIEALSVK